MTVGTFTLTFVCNRLPTQRLSFVYTRAYPHGLIHASRWIRCTWYMLFSAFLHTNIECEYVSKNLGAHSNPWAQHLTFHRFHPHVSPIAYEKWYSPYDF